VPKRRLSSVFLSPLHVRRRAHRSPFRGPSVVCASVFALAVLACFRPAAALDASELALIVNRNMPEGERLAQQYAAGRGVPANHIIELDLSNGEQMSFEEYERQVVPRVREFLRLNDPQRHIRCLVTFYGVPFRIAPHVPDLEEARELEQLRQQLGEAARQLSAATNDAEAMAVTLDSSFKPAQPKSLISARIGDESNGIWLDQLRQRLNTAGKSAIQSIARMTDSQQQQVAAEQFQGLVKRCRGPVDVTGLVGTEAGQPGAGATTAAAAASAPSGGPDRGKDAELARAGAGSNDSGLGISPAVLAAMPQEDRRFDPATRLAVRQRAAASAGLDGYCQLLLAQIGYLSGQDSEAATDSELALLWWTYYPRPRWQLNPLNYRLRMPGESRVLMVCRLDGPTPQVVKEIIVDSLVAEQRGLSGKIVVDARGLKPASADGHPDPYGVYDEELRTFASMAQQHASLPVVLDDKPAVLPAHSVQDVALYCGWYSLANYVPACSFVTGAVGMHIASFEMVSLRDPNNNGWVKGLLNDGVCATLGPVSEPYLQSFPRPEEFFPLLLTGKLTLAEVYWKTTPMASWRQCLVGDPLYTPFKMNPQFRVTDLPPALQTVFAGPSSASIPPAPLPPTAVAPATRPQ
jgi:uncharacterized protein (TIGR03790 family)